MNKCYWDTIPFDRNKWLYQEPKTHAEFAELRKAVVSLFDETRNISLVADVFQLDPNRVRKIFKMEGYKPEYEVTYSMSRADNNHYLEKKITMHEEESFCREAWNWALSRAWQGNPIKLT